MSEEGFDKPKCWNLCKVSQSKNNQCNFMKKWSTRKEKEGLSNIWRITSFSKTDTLKGKVE